MVYANVACVVSAQSTPDVNIRHTPAPGMYDFEMFQQKDLFYTPAGNDTLVLGGDQSRIKQCCVLSKTSCIRDCIGKFLNNREVYEWVNGFFSNPDVFKKWRGFLRDQKYGKKNVSPVSSNAQDHSTSISLCGAKSPQKRETLAC